MYTLVETRVEGKTNDVGKGGNDGTTLSGGIGFKKKHEQSSIGKVEYIYGYRW